MQLTATPPLTTGFLQTGALAGTLDAVAASTHFYLNTGKSPAFVWRYVASALLGPAASTGGGGIIVTGIAMHYAIAFGWTLLFFLAASRFSALRSNPWVIGPCYGLVVWLMMTRIIVPLTRIGPPKTFNATQAAIGALILVACIGIPIVFGAVRTLTSPRVA